MGNSSGLEVADRGHFVALFFQAPFKGTFLCAVWRSSTNDFNLSPLSLSYLWRRVASVKTRSKFSGNNKSPGNGTVENLGSSHSRGIPIKEAPRSSCLRRQHQQQQRHGPALSPVIQREFFRSSCALARSCLSAQPVIASNKFPDF